MISYGVIDATVIDTKEVSRVREASADGTTFLWTKWTLDVHMVVQPSLVSYAGGPPAAPFPLAGVMPAVTDRNIRQILRTDRKQLIYKVGADILLYSPAVGETVDANNGPIVEAVDIIQVFADKAILVRFRVTTWVADCGMQNDQNGFPMPSSTNPLLSLRWERHQDIDDLADAVMVTEGLATFNIGILKRLGQYPDMYRRDLIIPPPPNCRRISVQVAATSDGGGIRFRAVDKSLTFNIGATCDAVKLECYSTSWFNRTGGTAAAAGVGLGVLGGVLNLVPGIGGVLSSGLSRVTPAAPTGSAVPTYHTSVLSRAWGNRNSGRAQLTRIALGVALWRLGSITESHVYELQIQHDVFGKFVEVLCAKSSGIETAPPTAYASFGIQGQPDGTGIVYPGIIAPRGTDIMLAAFAGPGEEHDFDPSFNVTQNPLVGNPGQSLSNYTRGTLLEDVVAQVLANACDLGAGSRPANAGRGAELTVNNFLPAP